MHSHNFFADGQCYPWSFVIVFFRKGMEEIENVLIIPTRETRSIIRNRNYTIGSILLGFRWRTYFVAIGILYFNNQRIIQVPVFNCVTDQVADELGKQPWIYR